MINIITINAKIPVKTDQLLNRGIVVKPRGRKIFPNVTGIADKFLINAVDPVIEEWSVEIALSLKKKYIKNALLHIIINGNISFQVRSFFTLK